MGNNEGSSSIWNGKGKNDTKLWVRWEWQTVILYIRIGCLKPNCSKRLKGKKAVKVTIISSVW